MTLTRVFVSSVIDGFGPERAAARKAIEALRQQPVMAEDFGAKPHSAQTACLEAVRSSHIFVGIIGERYGFVTQSGVSVTEEEFIEARRRGLRILIFVQKGPKQSMQQEFLERLKQYEDGYHLDFFSTTEELTQKVTRALFDEVGQPNVRVLDVGSATDHFERHRWGDRSRPDPTMSRVTALFVPTRQGEEYLSVLDLSQSERHDNLLQMALFGRTAFFRKDLGGSVREAETSVTVEQGDEHHRPVAFAEAWTDGTLICGAALGVRREHTFGLGSMVIDQDEVARFLAAFCSYADGFYKGVNRAELISSLYVGVNIAGVQYKSFGRLPAVAPTQMTVPTSHFPDPVRIPLQPLKIARAQLSAGEDLARTLIELVARTFRTAGRYYTP